jgi:transketolase
MKAMRDSYGEALVEFGHEFPNLVVFDADVSKATRTVHFANAYPDRFFDMGISESNMVGVAAGMALLGKISIISTFAVFSPGRVYDQIRNTVCYSKANVKIISTHAGLSVGADGGTHQALEDIALTRVLPYMKVYAPADAYETKLIVREAIMTPGPVYVRLSRNETPEIFDNGHRHLPGIEVLRSGSDVAIIACGRMVADALEAANELEKLNIKCSVANVHTIKPLNEDELIELARKTGCVVTAEEHSIYGGLGGAVAEVLGEKCPVPLIRVGVHDRFGQSGSFEELYKEYALTSVDIIRAVQTALNRKEPFAK